MNVTETILQCESCLRFFANGAVISISCGDGLAMARSGRIESFVCGHDDCAAVATQNKQRDLSNRQASCRRIADWKQRHLPQRRRGGEVTASRPPVTARMPYKDSDDPPSSDYGAASERLIWEEAADRQRDVPVAPAGAGGHAQASPAQAVPVPNGGPDESPAERGGENEPRSQREFEESGAAANQNAALIDFFSDAKNHGKMWPMVYLEEISGAQRMNNRAIDLRAHFKPLGFGLWNEMRIYPATGALHSHYGMFPLAEVERRERERDLHRATMKEKKQGQKSF